MRSSCGCCCGTEWSGQVSQKRARQVSGQGRPGRRLAVLGLAPSEDRDCTSATDVCLSASLLLCTSEPLHLCACGGLLCCTPLHVSSIPSGRRVGRWVGSLAPPAAFFNVTPAWNLLDQPPRPYLPLTVVRPRHFSDEVPRPIHPLLRMPGSGNFVVSQQRDGHLHLQRSSPPSPD